MTSNGSLTAVVADDEQLAREELCFLLGKIDGMAVVAQAADGVQALADITRLEPDVAFLDVQMPGLTGFEVARRLLEHGTDLAVVFVTAFDHRAIEAFEVNAVDYVLKPVDPGRLEQAVQRVRKRRTEPPLGDQLERLVRLMSGQKDRRNQVAVRMADRIALVQAEDIIYASLSEDSISIVTGQVSGTSNYRTLDELQARLDPEVFWRVHRSHLVNINKIKEIVPWFSRNYILRMNGRQGDRDSGQPHADPPVAGIPETVVPANSSTRSPCPASSGPSTRPATSTGRCSSRKPPLRPPLPSTSPAGRRRWGRCGRRSTTGRPSSSAASSCGGTSSSPGSRPSPPPPSTRP